MITYASIFQKMTDEDEVWEDNDSENDDDGLLPILEPY